jgi:hypothetical protein
MKNLRQEFDDSIRPEYKRSDFNDLVRGKLGVTEVEFAELAGLLLSCIGEEEDIKFSISSIGNYLASHTAGEWTYEIDNANQITLRYWLSASNNVSETVSNPPCVLTSQDKAQLQGALLSGVARLKLKTSNK